MTRRLTREALRTSPRPVWLLTITAMGRTWRIGSDAVEVTTDSGDLLSYEAQLDGVSVSEKVGALGKVMQEPVIAFRSLFLDGALSLYGQGQDLTAGRGELAIWLEGETYETRKVVVSGRIQSAQMGRRDEVSISLGDKMGDDMGRLLPASAVVNDQTWPASASNVAGRVYPVVFGAPGTYTSATGVETGTTGSPAYMVVITGAAEKLLICDGSVAASSVLIFNQTDNSIETFNTSEATDALGRVVTLVDISGAASLTIASTDRYSVRWNNGGGLKVGGSALTGLGTIALYILGRSTTKIDTSAWAGHAAYLDGFLIDGFVDDPDFTPVDWLIDIALPLIPFSIRFGPDGLSPLRWRHDSLITDAEAIVNVDDAVDLDLDGVGITSSGQHFPEHRISYARREHKDEQLRTRTLTGETDADTTADNVGATGQLKATYFAQLAQTGTTTTSALEVVTSWVYDEATAVKVLDWRAALLSLPVQRVSYTASWDWGWLGVGMVVSLTDTSLLIAARVAVVDGISYSINGISVTFALMRDAVRDLNAPSA